MRGKVGKYLRTAKKGKLGYSIFPISLVISMGEVYVFSGSIEMRSMTFLGASLLCALLNSLLLWAGKRVPAKYFSTIAGLTCPAWSPRLVYCLLSPLP